MLAGKLDEKLSAWIDPNARMRRMFHAVGDGTFVADGRRFSHRAFMSEKLPPGGVMDSRLRPASAQPAQGRLRDDVIPKRPEKGYLAPVAASDLPPKETAALPPERNPAEFEGSVSPHALRVPPGSFLPGRKSGFRVWLQFLRFAGARRQHSVITPMPVRIDWKPTASMDSGKPQHHHYTSRIALGLRLRDWRSRETLTIAAAADALGVSTATWGHWETGEHLPNGDLLLAIEDLTGIPIHVLFCPHLEDCPYTSNALAPPGPSCCQCGVATAGKAPTR